MTLRALTRQGEFRTTPGMHAQTALKALVIGLGLLIMMGLGLLAFGFVKKLEDPDWHPFRSTSESASERIAEETTAPAPHSAKLTPARKNPPAAAAIDTLGTLDLGLPGGCEIRDLKPHGHLVYVLTGPAGVCGEVILVDIDAGRVLGRLTP